jgi:NitT/TauT family transport system ATP-binding protein
MVGNLIEVRNVSKRFSSARTQTVALQDISLTMEPGEFVTLLGTSGCGKTTLLNLIAGYSTPTSGEVLLNGQKVTKPGSDRGVLFQTPALFSWLTVLENVLFGPRARRVMSPTIEERARELLATVGLDGFESHFPSQLSGGMRHRLALARTLINDPAILLMDEPFGALDAQTRSQMQSFLLDLCQAQHTTVLFVTHDIEEAVLLADRVCVMTPRPGKILRFVAVRLPRPRQYDVTETRDFMAIRHELRILLAGTSSAGQPEAS